MDAGLRGQLLDGFREFLMLRGAGPPNLTWWGLVGVLAGVQTGLRELSPEDDEAATGLLLDLLDEFLAEAPLDRSRGALHREYALWRQEFPSAEYSLELERFRSSPPPETIGVDEVASALGIDRRGVFDLVAQGKLRLIRVGTEVRFRRAEVDRLSQGGSDAA